MRIDRPLVTLAGYYFLIYGALGALFPFLPLLLSDRGLDPVHISFVLTLIPATNLVAPPLWGALADALHARVALLRLASAACALASLLLIPRWGFAGALLALGTLSFFRSPLASLADAATCALLGPRGASYGRVRVWGSVAFAIFALAVGALDGSRHATALIAATVLCYLLAAASTLALPPVQIARERGIVRDALCWAGSPSALLLLLGNAAYYLAHAIYDAFLSLHLRSLGFGDLFVGGAWAAGVAVEIAVMVVVPPLLAGSARRTGALLVGAAAVACVRWSLLAGIVAPAPLLAQQALHGVTFGLWYLTLVQHIQASAPERLRTTLQSVAAASIGLGSTAGYQLGGRLFARGGGAACFRLAIGGAAVALLCYTASALSSRRP